MSRVLGMGLAGSLAALTALSPVSGQEYQRIPAAIHLHSTFSNGIYSPEELVEIAQSAGVRVVILTDHDTMRFDFGLPLMPWLTSRIAWPIIASMMDHGTSISEEGSEDYLSRLEAVGREYPEMLVLPGVEAIPFFYWKGNLWDGTLTLARGNEHIVVIGLESQEDFDGLPSVGNRTFPHIQLYSLLSLWPLILIFLGYRLFKFSGEAGGGLFRIPAFLLLLVGVLFLVHNLPFRFPKYDQYHGYPGTGPFQDLINYAHSRDALTFWAHPEAERDEEVPNIPIIDRIRMKTPSYHRDLLLTRNYTGIAVMAEGLEHVLPPGGIWDQVLMDYLLGRRGAPVWGIGEIDFKEDTFPMTETLTYLLVEDLTKNSVLDALGRGRAYAAHGADVQNVSLESFRVVAPDGRFAIMGEEIEVGVPPLLRFRTVRGEPTKGTQVRVIRNGSEIHRENRIGEGIDWEFEDQTVKSGDRVFYRLDISFPQSGRIVTNPIFVTCS